MASITYTPTPAPLDAAAALIVVAWFDRENGEYTLVPNIECLQVQVRIGAVPPQARFRYVFDSSDPAQPYPLTFEDIWPLGAGGQSDFVAGLGDELCVFAVDEAGNVALLFDGLADAPEIALSPKGQSVTFTASGVAVRCWDTVIQGSTWRDSDFADLTDGTKDVKTQLLARFNPDGEPNCTGAGCDTHGTHADAYPVFLDPLLCRDPDPRASWTLGGFVRYLLNLRGPDLIYVKNPVIKNPANFDKDLQAIEPTDPSGAGTIALTDPSTFTRKDIRLRDALACDRPWPVALDEELTRHGFDLIFRTGLDRDGLPLCQVRTSRRDGLGQGPPRDLRLQPTRLPAQVLDPARSNVQSLRLVRDGRDCANQFDAISRPTRYEVSIVLAPGFTIDPNDANDPSQFQSGALASASADMRKKYRVYVADENGSGHWDYKGGESDAGAWAADTSLNLDDVLGAPLDSPQYVRRSRPGLSPLFTLDDDGDPYPAEVAVCHGYQGPVPGVWDRSNAGAWRSAGNQGWRFLDNQLGIELTGDDPNGWQLPEDHDNPSTGVPDLLNGVEAQALSAAGSGESWLPLFYLRLTCVIEGDFGVDATAVKRSASPLGRTVARDIDGRHVFEKNLIDKSSFHNTSGAARTARDDTAEALSIASSYREAHEAPRVAGSVTIPWLCLSYELGDRARNIKGRDCSLAGTAAPESGQSAYYPTVAAITWDFDGHQSTTLQLSDLRAEAEVEVGR